MKTFGKYIIPGFMLSLVLLYSTPIKSLHNCSNLIHRHDAPCIAQEHPDCLICDLQVYPFIPASVDIISGATFPYSEFNNPPSGNPFRIYCNSYFNKGPPVCV